MYRPCRNINNLVCNLQKEILIAKQCFKLYFLNQRRVNLSVKCELPKNKGCVVCLHRKHCKPRLLPGLWRGTAYNFLSLGGNINTSSLSARFFSSYNDVSKDGGKDANTATTKQEVGQKIQGLVELSQLEEAVEVLKESVKSGIEPEENVISDLVHQLANHSEVAVVLDVQKFLKSNSLSSNVQFYQVLRDAYSKSGNIERGFEVLSALYMREDHGDADLFFTLLVTMTLRDFGHQRHLVDQFVLDLESGDLQTSAARASLWRCLVLVEQFSEANHLIHQFPHIKKSLPAQVAKLALSPLEIDFDRDAVYKWLIELDGIKQGLKAVVFNNFIEYKLSCGEWRQALELVSAALREERQISPRTLTKLTSQFLEQFSTTELVHNMSVWSQPEPLSLSQGPSKHNLRNDDKESIISKQSDMNVSEILENNESMNSELPAENLQRQKETRLVVVLDFSVFLYRLGWFDKFLFVRNRILEGYGTPLVVLPWSVLHKIDTSMDEKQRLEVCKFINDKLQGGYIVGQTLQEKPENLQTRKWTFDETILLCCQQWKEKYPSSRVVLLSEDISLRNKALVNGLESVHRENIWRHLGIHKPKQLKPSKCLAVFKLDRSTTKEELLEIFSPFGPIQDIYLVYDKQQQPRGFAFVYFVNTEDALEAFETTKSMGYTVDFAFDRDRKVETDTLALFGLSSDVERRDISSLFNKYGPIDDIRIQYHKLKNNQDRAGRYVGAFVTFKYKQDAVEAYKDSENIELDGAQITVEFATKKQNKPDSPALLAPGIQSRKLESHNDTDNREEDGDKPSPSYRLALFGLNYYTREDDLKRVFSEYGPVEDINLIYDREHGKSKGVGFICFKHDEDALEAFEASQGMELDGRQIIVDLEKIR